MSLDLTAAVEAAAREFAADRGFDDWDVADPIVRHQSAEIVLSYVTAAAPLIEAAVREQIAQVNVDGLACVAAERHRPERSGAGCECGFVVWSVEHVAVMTARELTPQIARGGAA